MAHQRIGGIGDHKNPEQQHPRLARQIHEQRDAERSAGDDHRHEAQPFGPQRVPRVLETHAQGHRQVRDREQRQRELERHEVRGERDRDQRRAEAGDAEDQRAKEGDAAKQRHLAPGDENFRQREISSSRAVQRFMARKRET